MWDGTTDCRSVGGHERVQLLSPAKCMRRHCAKRMSRHSAPRCGNVPVCLACIGVQAAAFLPHAYGNLDAQVAHLATVTVLRAALVVCHKLA